MKFSVLFIAGGMLGMLCGNGVRSRMSDFTLRKIFVVGICFVALYLIFKS